MIIVNWEIKLDNYIFIEDNGEEIKFGKVENKVLTKYRKINKTGIELGNIYRVKIVKKVEALQCYFVDLMSGVQGFLDFKDVVGNVKTGDTILVEVYKINLGNKAPNVRMNFSISSDFAVMHFKNSEILISKKIKEIPFDLDEMIKLKGKFGLKLRTKSIEFTEDTIFSDIKILYNKMLEITNSLNLLPVPDLVYRKDNYIRDFIFDNRGFECITNSDELYKKYKNDCFIENSFILDREYNILYDYNIGEYISTFVKREIDFEKLNIIFDSLEALTVIDVNSKNIIQGENKSKNALITNKLAIKEIFRQISFRDISGIILIDLINMNKRDKTEFENYLDTIKIDDGKIWSFYGFTKTGLYEITRQRGANGNN